MNLEIVKELVQSYDNDVAANNFHNTDTLAKILTMYSNEEAMGDFEQATKMENQITLLSQRHNLELT